MRVKKVVRERTRRQGKARHGETPHGKPMILRRPLPGEFLGELADIFVGVEVNVMERDDDE